MDRSLKTLLPKSKKAAHLLRAINNSPRQKLLQYLLQQGETYVLKIYKDLGLEQSVASLHLAILRKQGIVNTRREQKFIYYSVNKERLAAIVAVSWLLD
ncbi:MAG: transcriptional regulator [Chitinophagaceae bacterium]|nr:MAG: transcriptional regulator [Chitinophagaceae bacterium]